MHRVDGGEEDEIDTMQPDRCPHGRSVSAPHQDRHADGIRQRD
jgi:hypothetical protein